MNTRTLLLPLALVSALTLAACGDRDDDAAVSVEKNPDGSATVQVQVPEAIANPQQTLDDLGRQAATMSEEAKVQAAEAARAAAEATARALGRTEAEIAAAGDDAEQRARQALGMQ